MSNIISFFQKLIKGGVGIRAGGGGLENFSKINKRGGGRLFGTREYCDWNLLHKDRFIRFNSIFFVEHKNNTAEEIIEALYSA